jgi:phosphatidylinositol glycan class V
VAGIVISNICHLLSVLVLYHLVTLILQRPDRHQIAFVAAVLHVLTPASLFLSAPYAEALFSLLNFAGMVTYTWSKTAARAASPSFREDACKLSSGLLFALASSIRSNGLLSGLIFLYDVAGYLPRLVSAQPSFQDGRRIIVTCIAGSLVALGYVGPQYIAYNEFCGSKNATSSRPWCERTLPSIYTWVQSHYW